MEVYIDDIVIKLAAYKSHLADLCLAFEMMRRYELKMNPLKYSFGVSARKFLGFIIHDKGIEVDPKRKEKIKTVQAPTCKRDLQKFLGKVNYLRRFIANLFEKIIPFTPILKLKDEFEFTWGQSNKRHLRK
jgi:hypothetical protein